MDCERCLEIGCGVSNHFDIYASRPKVIDIDVREDIVQRRHVDTPNGKFVVADAHCLPFAPNSFSEVFATASLEHVDDPPLVLSEAHRVMRPNGRIVVDVPHPRYDRVMAWIVNGKKRYHGVTHKHLFEPGTIKGLVENAGFKVTEFSPRMWKSALVICSRWLLAKAMGRLDYDDDSGELLGVPSESKGWVRRKIDELLWLSENKQASPKRYYLLSLLRMPNLIFPWVTYIEAAKADKIN